MMTSKKNVIEFVGYICGLTSIILLFISMGYVMSLNPNYDFRTSMISGLGIIKGKQIFNTVIIITGLLHLLFFNSLRMYLRAEGANRQLISFGFLFGIIFSFAEMGVGIFPIIPFFSEHTKIAAIIFTSSLLLTLLYSILLIEYEETRVLAYIGFSAFVLNFIYKIMRTAFLEWLWGLSVWIWVLITAVSLMVIKTYRLNRNNRSHLGLSI